MNNEKALEALESNIRHTMTGTVKNESLALVAELRSALLSPFDEAIKIMEDKIAFINTETLEDCDRIKHYGEVLSALKARAGK